MGPYYMTALVSLLGPVGRIAAVANNPAPIRTIGAGPRRGQTFRSTVNTEVRAIGEIADATFSLTMTFDAPALSLRLEVVGDEGVLRCADPDTFDGPVEIRAHQSDEWRDITAPVAGTAQMRGFGVADLAAAIAEGRPHRTDAALARHVLEALFAIEQGAETHEWVPIHSTCSRPEPLTLTAWSTGVAS
jgi:predicted dehydrogenase